MIVYPEVQEVFIFTAFIVQHEFVSGAVKASTEPSVNNGVRSTRGIIYIIEYVLDAVDAVETVTDLRVDKGANRMRGISLYSV